MLHTRSNEFHTNIQICYTPRQTGVNQASIFCVFVFCSLNSNQKLPGSKYEINESGSQIIIMMMIMMTDDH